MSQYRRLYLPRSLGVDDDAQTVVDLMTEIAAASTDLAKRWDDIRDSLPSPTERLNILNALKRAGVRAHQPVRERLKRLRQRGPMRDGVGQVFELVDRLFEASTAGYGLLQAFRTAIPCVVHYENHHVELGGDKREVDFRGRRNWRSNLEQIVSRIEADVESQRSEMEMLGLYTQTTLANTQTTLSNRLQQLTLMLMWLTAFLLITTIIAVARH